MSSGFDPNIILKTRVGQLRLAVVGVGLFIVAFYGAGHDHLDLNDSEQPDCPSSVEFGRCPAVWAEKLGLAMIIIAWLFSIAMLICAVIPSMSHQVRMVDGFGHIGAGVMAFLGGILAIWFVMTLYWGLWVCDLKKHEGLKKYCTKEVFLTVNNDDLKDALKDGPGDASYYDYGRKGGARMFVGGRYRSQDVNASHGGKCWHFIAAAIFATAFLVLCILIFVMLKKAGPGPRGPMMVGGMMTQQPSQAPMSMHPSQMAQQQQQQQNPDQQSVHPSQMTQQPA